MARGGSKSDSGLKMFFMKVENVKHGEKIQISQTEVRGEKDYVKLDETVNQVSGKFHSAKIREWEYKGDVNYEVRVMLRDSLEGEMYTFICNLSNPIGRSIVNTLLALEKPIGDLLFRVYNDKVTGHSKLYVEHNGAKAGWKYAPADLKQYVSESAVKEKGKTVIRKDYYEHDQFLMKEFLAHVGTSVPDGMRGDLPGGSTDGPTDDLPF
jgi:hypothetical protein